MTRRLAEGLIALGFEAGVDFVAKDLRDGNGPFIAEWNSQTPRPTGAEIAAAVAEIEAEEAAPKFAPLERWRFMAILEKSGLENQIRAYIGTLSGDAQLAAKYRFQSAERYHIDDPLIKAVQAALKIPDETLQGLWRQAEDL